MSEIKFFKDMLAAEKIEVSVLPAKCQRKIAAYADLERAEIMLTKAKEKKEEQYVRSAGMQTKMDDLNEDIVDLIAEYLVDIEDEEPVDPNKEVPAPAPAAAPAPAKKEVPAPAPTPAPKAKEEEPIVVKKSRGASAFFMYEDDEE